MREKLSIGRRLAALALAAAFVACGERDAGDAGPRESPSEASDVRTALRALGKKRPRVELRDGRVSIAARDAWRSALLRRLARAAGFELDAGDLPPLRLTLDLDEVSVEDALVEILPGVDYHLEYRFDPARGAHVLQRVVARAAQGPAAAAPRDGRFRRRVDARTPEQRAQDEAEAARRDALAIERMASDAPAMRAQGLAEVDVTGPGGAQVLVLALRDPDPGAREVALGRLAELDADATRDTVHAALADPEPRVVRAALKALIAAGDERSVPELERLLASDLDPDTRALAQHVLEFLQ